MPFLSKTAGTAVVSRAQQAMAVRNSGVYGVDVYRPAGVPPVRSPADERMCGAAGCTGGWTMPWKNRRRPIFEQEWGCSSKCLTALVRAAVRRETGDTARVEQDEVHRHRVPLGLVLLAQGWITHPQLLSALDSQRATGRGRIGDWLAQSCGLPEDRIARGLGVQWNCPVLTVDGFSPQAMAMVMPKRLLAEFGQLPLRVAGTNLLYLAFEERMDAAVALGVEQMTGVKVESGLLAGSQFEKARGSLLAAEAAAVHMKLVADRDGLMMGVVRALEHRQPLAAKLVRVHHYYWLRMWLEGVAMGGVGTLPPSPEDVEDHLFMISNRS